MCELSSISSSWVGYFFVEVAMVFRWIFLNMVLIFPWPVFVHAAPAPSPVGDDCSKEYVMNCQVVGGSLSVVSVGTHGEPGNPGYCVTTCQAQLVSPNTLPQCPASCKTAGASTCTLAPPPGTTWDLVFDGSSYQDCKDRAIEQCKKYPPQFRQRCSSKTSPASMSTKF